MKRFLVALSVVCLGVATHAQEYPSRALKLVVPFAAGSTIDILGRAVGQGLSDKLG